MSNRMAVLFRAAFPVQQSINILLLGKISGIVTVCTVLSWNGSSTAGFDCGIGGALFAGNES